MMFEVFSLIDGISHGVTKTDDRKISKEEWCKSIDKIKAAGNSYANFINLKNVTEEDFETADLDGKGSVLLMEFCKWVKWGEITNDTEFAKDLRIRENTNLVEVNVKNTNKLAKSFINIKNYSYNYNIPSTSTEEIIFCDNNAEYYEYLLEKKLIVHSSTQVFPIEIYLH